MDAYHACIIAKIGLYINTCILHSNCYTKYMITCILIIDIELKYCYYNHIHNMNMFVNKYQEAQIAKAVKQKKSNKSWYAFKSLSAYFKIEKGNLISCPMNSDGTRDENSEDIDWYHIDDDLRMSLRAVFQVLTAHP